MTTAKKARQLTSTESGFDLPVQTVQLIRVYAVPVEDADDVMIRVTFRHDGSYAAQSAFNADLFTTTGGWVRVVYILGEDERATHLPSTHLPREKREAVRIGAEAFVAQLLQDARKVLGI